MANNHYLKHNLSSGKAIPQHDPNTVLDVLGLLADELQNQRSYYGEDGIENRLDRLDLAVECLIALALIPHLK